MPRCPMKDCPNIRQTSHIMCRDHWFQVPRELRDEVWQAWHERQRHNDPDTISRHRGAVRKALEAVKTRSTNSETPSLESDVVEIVRHLRRYRGAEVVASYPARYLWWVMCMGYDSAQPEEPHETVRLTVRRWVSLHQGFARWAGLTYRQPSQLSCALARRWGSAEDLPCPEEARP